MPEPEAPNPASRERAIFESALERDPDRRVAHVREAAGDDLALADRVLRLLAAHERAALGAATGTVQRWQLTDPEQVGPYRVIERIGEGGKGVVYRAATYRGRAEELREEPAR